MSAGRLLRFELHGKLRSHSPRKRVQRSVVSPVPFLPHLLHVLPLGTALVPLPPLLPVPHLLTVLVQAEVWAAQDLHVVFVSQP